MDQDHVPALFPTETLFAVVDGVPITESPDGQIIGWDCANPRKISANALHGVSVSLSEESFRMLIGAYHPAVKALPVP